MSDIDDDLYADDGVDDGLDDSLDQETDYGQGDGVADVLEVPDGTGIVDVEGDPVTEVEVDATEQAIPETDEDSDDVVDVPVEDLDSESGTGKSSAGPTHTGDFREGYEVSGRGVNEQGNQWDSRDYGPEAPNQNPYHYSNSDGSYYYDNPDGSRYYNDGQGAATYTAPSGLSYRRDG